MATTSTRRVGWLPEALLPDAVTSGGIDRDIAERGPPMIDLGMPETRYARSGDISIACQARE